MTYTVEQLTTWATEGAETWQASMPPGVIFSAVVPSADAVFFTITRGNQGAFIQVPAESMTSPDTWQSAAARMLDAVHRNQLRPLENGNVPLFTPSQPPEEPHAIHVHALLSDTVLRDAMRTEMEAGAAELTARRNGLWYLNPAYGLTRQSQMNCRRRLEVTPSVHDTFPNGLKKLD